MQHINVLILFKKLIKKNGILIFKSILRKKILKENPLLIRNLLCTPNDKFIIPRSTAAQLVPLTKEDIK